MRYTETMPSGATIRTVSVILTALMLTLTATSAGGLETGRARRRGNPMFEYVHHIAYVVSDMDDAVRIFGGKFKMELSERRVVGGEQSVEIAAFRCGPTLIEVIRPRSPASRISLL